MTRALSVWWEGAIVGSFQLNRHGEAVFAYSADWLASTEPRPISVSLPRRPLLAGGAALRLSLAGAQSKLPVIATTQGIALPEPGAPTTHIMKPPIERFPGTTENEAFCMRLAQGIGLNVAPVEIRTIGNRRVLLVERYDRTMVEGQIRRLHQEDFCQALGLPSSRKYAADGGPTFRDCFALVRRAATRPAKEILKLFDAVVFNLIIGNADAHSKNFSLLHRRSGIELAPLYDLLCTVAYPNISPTLAMKIAKRSTLDAIKATDWKVFAMESGLTEPYMRKRIRQLTGAVEDHIESAGAPFNSTDAGAGTLGRISDQIRGRIATLRRIC